MNDTTRTWPRVPRWLKRALLFWLRTSHVVAPHAAGSRAAFEHDVQECLRRLYSLAPALAHMYPVGAHAFAACLYADNLLKFAAREGLLAPGDVAVIRERFGRGSIIDTSAPVPRAASQFSAEASG